MDEIFTPEELQQFRDLRKRVDQQLPLTPEEQALLADLMRRFEEWDAANLARATARIQGRTETLHQENQILRDLLERKRQVLKRMEAMLTELTAEQATIDAEIARLLTPSELAELTAIPSR
jgi:hypothetical protein